MRGAAMLVDCATCTMKDLACGDCVVTLLLGPVDVQADRGVLGVLADAGLVPPLRLVPNAGDQRELPARRARDAG